MLQNINGVEQGRNPVGNIMIVDDDKDFLWIVNALFTSHGYQVNSATSGQEALNMLEEKNPDVIILDINMPGMDGWETYQYLRAWSDAPVLILTGAGLVTGELSSQQFDTNSLMQKPFHSNELLEQVNSLLNNRHARTQGAGQYSSTRTSRVKPSVSVIIPTLNEVNNLPLILPFLPMDLIDEVILVDGRSTDGTVEIARRLMPAIKVVMEQKPGKGAALLAGYRASSGDILIVLDADGSNDPREVPRFLNALVQGADFVKGSRFASGGGTTDMTRIRRWGNSFFVKTVNLLFNTSWTDLCYGYHAFWASNLCTLDLEGADGFEIDTALYLRAINDKLKIIEVPSFEGYRFHGVGKLRTIPDGIRVLYTIFREFLHSILHPVRDLPVGFRGEVLQKDVAHAALKLERRTTDQ